jgi:hypothetical protein
MAMGFFIVLKLAGTTQGFVWATRVTLIIKNRALTKRSFIVFIIIQV